MSKAKTLFNRRKHRVRRKLRKNNPGYPRLSVFRSDRNISAQIIDDVQGKTIASASTMEKDIRSSGKGNDVDAAQKIGKLIGERASKAGVTEVVFDRGGYRYHGRVKALADAAREAGLKF